MAQALLEPFPERQGGERLPTRLEVQPSSVEQVGDVVSKFLVRHLGGVVDNRQDVREQQPPGRPGGHNPRLVRHSRSQHTSHIVTASIWSSTGLVAFPEQRRRDAVQPNRLGGHLGEPAPLHKPGDSGHGEWLTDDAGERIGELVGMLGEQGHRDWFRCQPRRQAQQQQCSRVVGGKSVERHRP